MDVEFDFCFFLCLTFYHLKTDVHQSEFAEAQALSNGCYKTVIGACVYLHIIQCSHLETS